MPVQQTIDLATVAKIGVGGLSQQAIEAGYAAVETALKRLRGEDESNTLALLKVPETKDDLGPMREAADRMRREATDIVVLGVGGSSLGGQTICQLADYAVPGAGRLADGPRLHFLDNLDPVTFQTVLDRLPLATTRFAAISKSGGTGETLMQVMAVLSALDKAGLRARAGELIIGLSEPRKPGGKSALRDLLEPEGVSFLEHHTGVGGRYSCLTNVGLLPAAVMGLDVDAIRRGAAKAFAPVRAGMPATEIPASTGAALNIAAQFEDKPIHVMLAYSDRLERFTRWWVQLWAESVGKDGKGTTPVAAIGPVDQHSQLQLYLAGPGDKLFTVITTDSAGKGPVIDAELAKRAGEPGFAGKHVGDLVAAQGRATADTLAKNRRPVRRIAIDNLDEEAMGELMMSFMLETILSGYAMGIDPFDQPAVEEGKILAKQYLAEARG